MILNKWPPGVRNGGFPANTIVSEGRWRGCDCNHSSLCGRFLAQWGFVASNGPYRIFRQILKRRAARAKSVVSLTQRLNPQNLIVFVEQLAEREKARTLFGPGFESLTAEAAAKHSAVLT
jgi:hypothetical protein